MTSLLGRKCIQLPKLIYQSAAFCTVGDTGDVGHSLIQGFKAFRTSKENPADHKVDNLGLFYTIPKDFDSKEILQKQRNFARQCNAFNETSFMIRNPALEVIHYLKNADYSQPIQKYVLYGRRGAGKSSTMLHLLHYAYLSNYLIVNVPYVRHWLKVYHADTMHLSEFKPGFYDFPVKAVNWLKFFLRQNEHILKNETDITVSKDFVWSHRESTKTGDSILSLVNFGINRGKYATEVISILLDEIKILSKAEKVRTLVAIDGFNGFFGTFTRIKNEQHKLVMPDQIALFEPFINFTKADWHNGAAILIVDGYTVFDDEKLGEVKLPDSPFTLLGVKGFEHLDPFIPVEVKFLSNKEMTSMLCYFRDRKWLGTADGDDELKFLAGGSAYDLRQLCKAIY